jgi:cytochrome c-type biogenesis protein CcmE
LHQGSVGAILTVDPFPKVLMTHRYIKVGATVTVLLLAFVGLMYATLREGTEYYKHVDEVMSTPQTWEGRRLQLHGFVVPGSILVKPNTLEYKFKIQNKGAIVDASYKGVVPDTFKDESEVVLKGQMTPQGFHTEPNGIMAKCPSKYEAAKKVS